MRCPSQEWDDYSRQEDKFQAMEEAWGEKCPDYHADCIACKAWKHFEETGEIL